MAFPSLSIGDLKVKTPIIQGGMGVGISLSGLASAVAAAGGIGVIAAAGIGMGRPGYATDFVRTNNDALRDEIRAARAKSDGPLGVNIMVALTNYAELVSTAMREGVEAVISGAGLPLDMPSLLPEGCRTKLIPIVSSARAAAILCRKWLSRFGRTPDAFVVEGPMAGGHLGFKPEDILDSGHSLETVVPQVIEAVGAYRGPDGKPIPVIAAGGVYTGADILKYLRMGAAGVQMGTRFVATDECDADMAFKQTYIDAREEDIAIIKSPVGLPGRAIINNFIRAVQRGEKIPKVCPFNCTHNCDGTTAPYCIMLALMNAKKGLLDHGFAFAGQNAWRVQEIVSVKRLMESLEAEYDAAVAAGA
ncbi:Dihydroorotate dehydrogenase [Fundidesulfovibrio magnetotacticus]|uniref:Dihydroorotate dehydrogenase n=1 Tax=Fundidesulfovibrio magnetotacticus TaxID=2730080 RepID=A0A6V8M3G5_9BACT|nr:nitronate monooxygenase family protein [Fundidesulfovibrio magnetotacticus]GFK95005.1 Dihydroorotate dehydrogenase [Fundidesulfovibrio magnetotacticus]